jgi:hypothetical protein
VVIIGDDVVFVLAIITHDLFIKESIVRLAQLPFLEDVCIFGVATLNRICPELGGHYPFASLALKAKLAE